MAPSEVLIPAPETLEDLAIRNRSLYADAVPFPHAVFDGFLPEEVLNAVLGEFPGPDQIAWERFDHVSSRKLASSDERSMGPVTRRLFHELNSSPFVAFLEKLTGIEGLIPDPHLVGGGLHQIERGGYLGVHADFNLHPRLNLDRRLNLLIFLNRNWEERWGGHLELWNRAMTSCERRLLPVFNRCVVFSTTDTSFHGHPDPLNCPPDRSRRSLALYYYTNGRPQEEVSEPHSTLHQRRPGGAQVRVRTKRRDRPVRRLLRALTPPILDEIYRRLRGRPGKG